FRLETMQRACDPRSWREGSIRSSMAYRLRRTETIRHCLRRLARKELRAAQDNLRLGDDHNVVVLCAELSKKRSVCDGVVDVDRLRLAGDRYQCALRQKALEHTRQVFTHTSSDYVHTLERAWKASQP